MQQRVQAYRNLDQLGDNPYPGRGLVIGLDRAGKQLIQIYWTMGRSDRSRNRVFVTDVDGSIRTDFADPSKGDDPTNVIYRALAEENGLYVVSNGNQTDTVLACQPQLNLLQALRSRRYEDDPPNYTPRITATWLLRDEKFYGEIVVLKRSVFSAETERQFFGFGHGVLGPGFGYCVHTYQGDGDPLPSFRGEPFIVPLADETRDNLARFWEALDKNNRVSLAVKFIDIATGKSEIATINKYRQVAPTA